MALGKDYAAQECSVARALEVIGERWTLLVVRDAFYGVRRYNDFLSHLGLPRAVLAARLQSLERSGVLDKHLYQESPPRYEYVLTDSGRALWPVLRSLMLWGNEHVDGTRRLRVLVHAPCGKELGSAGECAACGVAGVDPGDVEMRPGPDMDMNPSDPDPVQAALLVPHRLLEPVVTNP